jgi:hypothetical protein
MYHLRMRYDHSMLISITSNVGIAVAVAVAATVKSRHVQVMQVAQVDRHYKLFRIYISGVECLSNNVRNLHGFSLTHVSVAELRMSVAMQKTLLLVHILQAVLNSIMNASKDVLVSYLE